MAGEWPFKNTNVELKDNMNKQFCYMKQISLIEELQKLGEEAHSELENTQFESLTPFEKNRERILNAIFYLENKIKNSKEIVKNQESFEQKKLELTVKINELDEKIYEKLENELKRIKQESRDLQKSRESVSKFKSLRNLKRGFEVDQKL